MIYVKEFGFKTNKKNIFQMESTISNSRIEKRIRIMKKQNKGNVILFVSNSYRLCIKAPMERRGRKLVGISF